MAPNLRSERRTIAFLDLSRFTTLNAVHGDTTAVEVLQSFREIVNAAADDRAIVVKSLGDGFLLQSPTPTDGITVACEIVRAVHDTEGMPDVSGGLHHGPIVMRDRDVFGNTVNLASRMSDAAPPAHLYVTRDIARAGSTDPCVAVQPLGEIEIRGLLEPVETFDLQPCDGDLAGTVTDPVCGMRLVPGGSALTVLHKGLEVWFCSEDCRQRFTVDSDRFASASAET